MTTESTWAPPAEFDEYRIVRPLGRGGMGHVYLGHDTLLDRPVAIKFIATHDPDVHARQRFAIEGRAIARLQHPNVVSVYRVGEVDKHPYLISEFVRGRSLDEIDTPQTGAEVARIGLALARGLAAAHRRGVLHRDIKPANAMIAADDEIKLLDFGLAKLVELPVGVDVTQAPVVEVVTPAKFADSSPLLDEGDTQTFQGEPTPPSASDLGLTGAGAVMGTPHYMAPEIWRGEPATTRSDVYSLGALLFRIASGRPPHVAISMQELCTRVVFENARPLAQLAKGIDPSLAAIVDRCLQREPAARFANSDELRDALERLAPAPQLALPDGNPYRGLAAFDAEHRALYFGRSTEVRSVIERLRAEALIVVCGVSGTGKSSLVRAGVIPHVLEGSLDDGRTWMSVTVVPGRKPLATLAAALAPMVASSEDELARRATSESPSFVRQLRHLLGADRGLLVFVDQLEELVTLSDASEAKAVGELIAHATIVAGGVRIVATVRSDFLGHLAELPGLGEQLERALHLLRPMTADGIRDAIVGPARAMGVAFESESLVELLVDETVKDPSSLPLLQFALAELWDARDRDRKLITTHAFEQIGGVAGALVKHADGVISRLIPDQRVAARRILLRLVSAEGTRARRTAAELDAPATQASLDALVRGRLVMTRETDAGVEYELAHEALIQSWSTLRQWLADDAGRGLLKERLAKAAAEWERLQRSRDALWRDRMLAEAAQLADDELTSLQAAFIAASRWASRRRRWLRRVIVAGIPVVLVSAYLLVGYAQRSELRRRADAQLDDSGRLLDSARANAAAAATARDEAFAGFDRGDWEAAESAWTRVRGMDAETERQLSRASQTLEAALKIDPANERVAEMFGDVLLERVLAAERDRRTSARDELIERLALYDTDGKRRGVLAAPAHLAIAATPAAAVRLERVAADVRGHRRVVDARDLGTTPQLGVTVEAGSYVLVLTAVGHATVRYPIRIARGQEARVAVTLPTTVPEGFAYVPPGRFLFGSADEGLRTGFLGTAPLHELAGGAYAIAIHETTFGEWIAYLKTLAPADRDTRIPRVVKGIHKAMEIAELAGGRWQLTMQPAERTYTAIAGDHVVYGKRDRRSDQDWLRMPVAGVRYEDAEAYAAWLRTTGKVPGARICTELEWERAARGADDREYPHGDVLEPDDANFDATYRKHPDGFGPDEVGSHPESQSVFGVHDLSGNVWEWTRSSFSPTDRVIRGGSFYFTSKSARVTNREVSDPTVRDAQLGVRICADVK